MVLKWRRPTNDGGDSNLRYRVAYTEVKTGKDQGKATNVTGLTVTQYTVRGLKPGVTYKFQVFASNRGGESEPAEEQYLVSADALGL